jgi:hypothetical protein
MAAMEGASPRPEKRADIAKKKRRTQLAVLPYPSPEEIKKQTCKITRILCGAGYAIVPAPRCGAFFDPRHNVEGMARQAARHCVVLTYRFRHAAPLGAPSRRRYGAGPRFRRLHRPTFGTPVRSPFGQPRHRASGRPSGPAVSELLAAGHSARGRSPGAARELGGGAFIPRLRAPHPILPISRLMREPSVDRTVTTIFL